MAWPTATKKRHRTLFGADQFMRALKYRVVLPSGRGPFPGSAVEKSLERIPYRGQPSDSSTTHPSPPVGLWGYAPDPDRHFQNSRKIRDISVSLVGRDVGRNRNVSNNLMISMHDGGL